MSVEEDAELKNLVAQTLENKGILPKIRAELRANVFLALEENPSTKETLLKNDELSAFVKIPIGALILNLIREFLEFFELEFTLSVFDPETKYGKEYSSLTKENMIRELKLAGCKKNNPLLYEVIKGVISSSEKNLDNPQVDVSGSGDSGLLMPSPVGLNSTYVKNKSDPDSVPVSPIEKDESKVEEESIKEMVSTNISGSESPADSKSDSGQSPRNSDGLLFLNGNTKEAKVNSPPPTSKNPIEIDLLTFTPVKETKPTEVDKNNKLLSNETKTTENKEAPKLSVLGDLPPLNPTVGEKGDKINELKAIIDKWPDLENEDESSLGSKSSKDQIIPKSAAQLKSDKSDYSHKSDKTESAEDFEEEISDLINGHTPSDSQLTVDETISKASTAADYLESI